MYAKMKLLLPFAILVLFLNQTHALWSPSPGQSWSNLIGIKDKSNIFNRKEQILTIDLEKSEEYIPQLHKQDKKVICYFSGGTIEPHRNDYNDYLKYGDEFVYTNKKNDTGEYWLHVEKKDILEPLILRRMMKAQSVGCDAIEVDHLNAYDHEPGDHGFTKEQTINFAKWIAADAHKVGISIGFNNLASLASQLVDDFDFATVENCAKDKNRCAKYEEFPKRGKAVFTIHYGNSGSFSSQKSSLIKEQKNMGFTCVFADNQNLHNPTYVYNCDNGSTSNTKGRIPKVTTAASVKESITSTVKTSTTGKTSTVTSKPVTPLISSESINSSVSNNSTHLDISGNPIVENISGKNEEVVPDAYLNNESKVPNFPDSNDFDDYVDPSSKKTKEALVISLSSVALVALGFVIYKGTRKFKGKRSSDSTIQLGMNYY